MKTLPALAGVFALAIAFTAAPWCATTSEAAPTRAAATTAPAAPKLHAAMRGLWQGHAATTRDYANAVKAGDDAAANKAADAVVANARQIADAVGGFYGDAAGKQMLELLAGHWGGVKALTDAGKAGDNAAGAKAMQDLTANADAIAKFLSGANPNLPESAVKNLLVTHAGHHAQLVGDLMKGDTAAAAKTWSAMQAHMDTIADALAGGIAKQFPAKAS
ncbi:MAG: hypothetical protein ACTHK2_06110 [Dokdonella sp.]|uniref:hypothetical protein n=1 Tax=Dokdonella sp. TaxID=2291710 RepID=UPI003F7DA4F1